MLLDNCVPRRLASRLVGYEVRHASELGFAALSNGKLLSAAASSGFDLLLTVDRNMSAQQNRGALPVAVVVLAIKGNTVSRIEPLLPQVMSLLRQRLQLRVYLIGEDTSGG